LVNDWLLRWAAGNFPRATLRSDFATHKMESPGVSTQEFLRLPSCLRESLCTDSLVFDRFTPFASARGAFCSNFFCTAFAVHKVDRRCKIFRIGDRKISPRTTRSENRMMQISLILSSIFGFAYNAQVQAALVQMKRARFDRHRVLMHA
jgi:hypothetical protein